MNILYSLMAIGAIFLTYIVSKNIVITALLVCSLTYIIYLRQRLAYLSATQPTQTLNNQERVTKPESCNKPIQLELCIEERTGRVLIASCDKKFVDALLSFLLLPLGKVIRLTDKNSGIGSMDELYKSVEALDTESFCTRAWKNMLLDPRSAYGKVFSNLAVKIDETDYNKCYTCSEYPCWSPNLHSGFTSKVENSICGCGRAMKIILNLLPDSNVNTAQGFVSAERFIVSDDLRVKQEDIEEAQLRLNKIGIYNTNETFTKTVHIGTEEVLQLLHHSLISKTVLTNVFQPNAKTTYDNQSRYLFTFKPQFFQKSILVKLWFSPTTQKIVCAETQEDFIDLLFSILTLPLGSIMNLFPGSFSLGSIRNLHNSVIVLNEKAKISLENTMMLSDPKLERMFSCENQLFEIQEYSNTSLYVKFNSYSLLIMNPKKAGACPVGSGGGFVKKQGNFLVTDSLLVKPLQVVKDMSRLVTPIPDLKKIQVFVGKEEAVALLEAALTCPTNVLTRAVGKFVFR